jgi:alpha-glucosidase
MADFVWWKHGVVYQVYPRSFQDTNGDDVGDLKGISERLDYLAWLGVDAIWISPIYPTPMADFGYDVSDYCNIDPLFGSLDAPNNWLSQFGGPAWAREARTGQFYLHSFLPEQPDLNWRNPDVRAAMYDVLRFWLDHGVDGFRVDVIWLLIKDAALRDNPPNPNYRSTEAGIHRFLQVYSADQPETHEVIAEMRSVLDHYDERVLIGKIYLPIERLVTYYGQDLRGAQLPFNFQLLHTAWTATAVGKLVTDYEAALPSGGWPNWVLGNHDQPRIAARVGRSAGAYRSDAAADAARHADNVLRRRAWHRQSSHPARRGERSVGEKRAGPRPRPRSLAHAVPVGRHIERRLYQRHTLAACRSVLQIAQRKGSARRSNVDPQPLPRFVGH